MALKNEIRGGIMKARKTALLLGLFAFVAGPLPALAQQSGQSLAQKASKVTEQEKAAPKAKIVWTNENLPTSGDVSIVGKVPPQANATNTSAAQAGAVAAPSANDAAELTAKRAKLESQLADAKNKLKSAQTDLNIAQREYKLDSDQYYSAPDYASNQKGKAKLDADQNQITTKQSAVDAAQKKVTDLQKQIDEVNDKLKASTPHAAANPQPKS
jgi:chromosome segregation ATPase